ncbi:phenylacetate--CoA ligase family protein [Desulfatiferula olefinivorans]
MIIKKLSKLREVSACRSMTPGRLAELRDQRLRGIITHAYRTTRFYRSLMDEAGIKPADIRTARDLVYLPTISKTDIQARYETILSDRFSPDQCLVRTTSGSSGKMLRVLWETDSFWNRLCMYYRCLSMIGYTPFKKLLYFLPTPEKTGFTFGLFRQRGLEPGMPFEEIRRHLLEFKPDIMAIYPSYAMDLGRFLSSDDIVRIGIQAISLNSEMILPKDRAFIERTFKCLTYDEYSSVEMGFIASMCKRKNMHVFTDNVVLEILDAKGNPALPGERGEIVLTSLTNYAMPFLRYRIGDYSYLREETCSCGLPFPLIGPIEGRKDDSFEMADGTEIPAWKIYEAVERPLESYGMDKMLLADFYLVQKQKDRAEFYYVKGPDFEAGYLPRLKQGMLALFGNDLSVRIKETDNIDRVKTVKRKYIHRDVA